MHEYFSEDLVPAHRQQLAITEIIHGEVSETQDVVVFRNPLFGVVMALDNVVQTTTGDEFIYHEMMTHVPILAHGDAKRVLIIGGGDGGILRHVLMHKKVSHVTMVEIEPRVIELTQRYMPQICGEAFDDPRANIVIDDGCKFVKESTEAFDVIIVDSTDPEGPGKVLFTPEFYADCKARLTPGGVMVTQSGVPFSQPQTLCDCTVNLAKSFADVTFYMAAIPTYISGAMALGFATDNKALRQVDVATLRSRLADSQVGECGYYTPDVHRAAFALPRYVENLIENNA